MKMESAGVEPWAADASRNMLPCPKLLPDSLVIPLEDRVDLQPSQPLRRHRQSLRLRQYRFHEAAQTLWHFFWHEFCDWYLELKKLRLRRQHRTQRALAESADRV